MRKMSAQFLRGVCGLVLATGAPTMVASARTPSPVLVIAAAFAQTAESPTAATTSGGAQAKLETDGSALAKAAAAAIRADGNLVDGAALRLKLSASGRVVSLTGKAGTLYDRFRAVALAEGQPGVARVNPSIRIEPATKADTAAVERAVRDALAQAAVASEGLQVFVDAGGTVHLGGNVTDVWRTVNAVRRVPGVTAIGDYDAQMPNQAPPPTRDGMSLIVVPPTAQQDQTIEKQAREALAAAGLTGVTATVAASIVTLAGQARGVEAAMTAVDVARGVPGVLGVVNRATVPARVQRRGDSQPDSAIRAAVESAVRRAGGYRIDRLAVRVVDGQVYLTGSADHADAGYRAVERAVAVPGVRSVVDALTYPR